MDRVEEQPRKTMKATVRVTLVLWTTNRGDINYGHWALVMRDNNDILCGGDSTMKPGVWWL